MITLSAILFCVFYCTLHVTLYLGSDKMPCYSALVRINVLLYSLRIQMHLIMNKFEQLKKRSIHFIQAEQIVNEERSFYSFWDKCGGENGTRIGEECEYMLSRLSYVSYMNGIRVSFNSIQRDTQCWRNGAFTKERNIYSIWMISVGSTLKSTRTFGNLWKLILNSSEKMCTECVPNLYIPDTRTR